MIGNVQLVGFVTAISVLVTPRVRSQTTVEIHHTNDVNMHFFQTGASRTDCKSGGKCYGGLYLLTKTLGGTGKDTTQHLLNLDTGNFFNTRFLNMGTEDENQANNTEKKEDPKDILLDDIKKIRYNVMALGTDELSGGIDKLAYYVRTMRESTSCEFVCSDIQFATNTENGKHLSEKCHRNLVKMFSVLKVGIVSHITPDFKPPDGVKIVPENLRVAIDELKHEFYVDVIMLLDSSNTIITYETTFLAGIDVDIIFSGYRNAMFYNGNITPHGTTPDFPYPHKIQIPAKRAGENRSVYVAGSYVHGIYVGHLKFQATAERKNNEIKIQRGSNPVLVQGIDYCLAAGRPREPSSCSESPKDSTIKGNEDGSWVSIEPGGKTRVCSPPLRCSDYPYYYAALAKFLGGVCGESAFQTDGSRRCWSQECGMGNLISDALVHATALIRDLTPAHHWTSAAVAVLHGHMIARGLLSGDIYRSYLQLLIPNDSPVSMVHLSGSEFYRLINASLHVHYTHKKDHYQPGYLQTSGIVVRHYPITKTSPGKIHSIKALCADCSSPEYRAVKGDEHVMLAIVLPNEMIEEDKKMHGKDSVFNGKTPTPVFSSLHKEVEKYVNQRSPLIVYEGSRLVKKKRPKAHTHMDQSDAIGQRKPVCWISLLLACIACCVNTP